jgi:hypothetical protein
MEGVSGSNTGDCGVRRRFTLLDARALLAATQVGILPAPPFLAELVATLKTIDPGALHSRRYWQTVLLETPSSGQIPSVLFVSARSATAVLYRVPAWYEGGASPTGQLLTVSEDVSLLLFPLLFSWSFAVLLLRLLPPRPPPRLLARQPGFWACVAAVATVVVAHWIEAAMRRPCVLPVAIPGSVAIAWLALAVCRRWAAEKSWLDRLGRAIGLAWLALSLPLAVWSIWFWWS